jgi:hypothetical protein
MYQNKENEDKAKEDKTKETAWSRYADNTISSTQRKYTTGEFKIAEEGWRPTGMTKRNKTPSELEKKTEKQAEKEKKETN